MTATSAAEKSFCYTGLILSDWPFCDSWEDSSSPGLQSDSRSLPAIISFHFITNQAVKIMFHYLMNDTRLWRLSQRRQWWRSDASWWGTVGDLFEGWTFELVRSALLIKRLDTTTTTQAQLPVFVGKNPVYCKCWVYYSVIIIPVKCIWMHWICVTFKYTWDDYSNTYCCFL